jgi:hypothetical protein
MRSLTGGQAAVGLLVAIVGGCTPEESVPGPLSCADLPEDHALETPDDVRFALDAVIPLQPPLEGVSIDLVTFEHEQDFFRANLDFNTLSAPPRERAYRVEMNSRLLDDPPSWDAVLAILVHETQHLVDFVGMDQQELAAWGVWYATTDDFSAYERATDERALELGCASGLAAFRVWLYDHVDDATEAQKRHDYYTPDEIRDWVIANTLR